MQPPAQRPQRLAGPHGHERDRRGPGVDEQPEPRDRLGRLAARVAERLHEVRPAGRGQQQPRRGEQHHERHEREARPEAVRAQPPALPQEHARDGHEQHGRLAREHAHGEHGPHRGVAPAPEREQARADGELRQHVVHLEGVEHVEPEQVRVRREQDDRERRRPLRPAVGAEHGPHQGRERERRRGGERVEARPRRARQHAGEPRPEPAEDVRLRLREVQPRRGVGHRPVVLDARAGVGEHVDRAVEPDEDGRREQGEQERAGHGIGCGGRASAARNFAPPLLPDAPARPDAPALLAVDLGLRTGVAAFARDGRLVWARSQNVGTRTRLRAAANAVLDGLPALERVVLEGGGDLARLWAGVAEKRGLHVRVIDAGVWRRALLLPREQRSGTDAKAAADGLARAVIAWSGAPAPRGALRHDAAEAVAVGLWGVLDAGWLDAVPERVRRR